MWRQLAARPGTEHMARSEVVKVIVDRFLVRRTPPHIVIVQARPFDVTWGPDRLWRDEDGAPVAQ